MYNNKYSTAAESDTPTAGPGPSPPRPCRVIATASLSSHRHRVLVELLQERDEHRGVEQHGAEPGRELASGARDGRCDSGVGEREQAGDLGGGEGRVGGCHDGADGHERGVEHGRPRARARTQRHAETDAGA